MSEILSQDELDALLSQEMAAPTLTDEEIDALGEIGNISMGTAATTLFTLLNNKVSITTPKVELTTIKKLAEEFYDPSVLIHITYKVGLKGENLLLLRVEDVRIITDLMMGGDGSNIEDAELNDMHLSAISEAMNQMIGSSSTSMSEMLKTKIDISPPQAYHEKIAETDFSQFNIAADDTVVKIAFNMTVGDLIDSDIMQILPINTAKQMLANMFNTDEDVADSPEPAQAPAPEASQPAPPKPADTPAPPQKSKPAPQQKPKQNINAANVEFQSFDDGADEMYYNNEIELIKDVPLEITVELGKTGKRINEILDFGVGSVIELDRLVGEHLDVLANGKRIAKGEVVVVDENYGVRITDIIASNRVFE